MFLSEFLNRFSAYCSFVALAVAALEAAELQNLQGFWLPAAEKFTEEEVDAAVAISGLLKILACLCMFQALYDQHSSTWVIQAQQMDLDILGWEMPPAQVCILAVKATACNWCVCLQNWRMTYLWRHSQSEVVFTCRCRQSIRYWCWHSFHCLRHTYTQWRVLC